MANITSRASTAGQDAAPRFGDTRIPPELLLCGVGVLLFSVLFLGWAHVPSIVAIDHAFFDVFGRVTRESWVLDKLVVEMFRTNTAKIVPLLACIVWLLFERKRQGQNIAFFGSLLLGPFLAMAASRLLQNLSAYRPRPIHNSEIVYELPLGIETTTLEGWSSFPSDTSALAFAIAAGIFLASRRLGIAAFLWATVVIAFPRAYAGLHYPSDLMGGALIGVICTMGAAPMILRAIESRTRLTIDEKWQPWLSAIAFLYMFQLGAMFDDVRAYGSFAAELLGR
jgi:undecaprenyl-diphosphatase